MKKYYQSVTVAQTYPELFACDGLSSPSGCCIMCVALCMLIFIGWKRSALLAACGWSYFRHLCTLFVAAIKLCAIHGYFFELCGCSQWYSVRIELVRTRAHGWSAL